MAPPMSEALHHSSQSETRVTIAHIQELAAVSGQAPELHEQLQQLRGEVHATLHDEFDCVAANREQLRSLLTDAVLKLSMIADGMTTTTGLTVQRLQAVGPSS